MVQIAYGLDSIWIRKNMDRIAYGLNMDMDMHMDQMHYQKLDQNLSEDIGKPNKSHWVFTIFK